MPTLINPIYDFDFEFENNLAVVRRNNKYGVINRIGKEVIVCKYDGLVSNKKGNFIASIKKSYHDELYGVIDSTDRIAIPIIYKKIELAANNIFIAESNNGKGLLNNLNDTIVNFVYKEIKAGNTNLLAASSKSDNWGFVNFKGDTIIPFEYNDARAFVNNYAIVKKGRYGIINSLGEIVLPFEFDDIIYADKQIVKAYKEENYGFYNLKGQKLTDCIYDDDDYSDQSFVMPHVSLDRNKFGKFSNGYAIVGINGRLGAIDKQGKESISLYYHSMSDFDEKGIAVVSYKSYFGLVDKTGKKLTTINYPQITRDEISGYYYLEMKDERKSERDYRKLKSGYFGIDGMFYSNIFIDFPKIETDEEVVEKIRKEYQNIVAKEKNNKGVNVKISEYISAVIGANKMVLTDSYTNINYEYYYNDSLNKYGPFFILKTDESGEKPLYDRYYYKNAEIVRWVDKSGKQQLVTNAPFAPENNEHFIARLNKAVCENQLLITTSKKNKEVRQIEKLVVDIDADIQAGKYKKGDVEDNSYENGSSGSEEYIDDNSDPIYKRTYSGGDHSDEEIKEYYKKGKLIYMLSTHYASEYMRMDSFFGEYCSKTEIFYFADEGKRECKTYQYNNGEILVIN